MAKARYYGIGYMDLGTSMIFICMGINNGF